MKTYVVYGANGFIGSSIVEELGKQSLVYAVDRYSSPPIFKDKSSIKIRKADIRQTNEVFAEKIDGVVWAVGGVIPADNLDNKDILELMGPTIRILEVFMKRKVPIIIISSAGMLYKPQGGLLTENSTVEPWTWYGLQKQILEQSLKLLSREYKNDRLTIFRVTSVYGERQPTEKGQGVIGKMIKCCLLGETFPLLGSDKSTRDYVYVRDLAEVVSQALSKPLKYTVYNVSSGKSLSIAEVKNLIELITGKKIKFDKNSKRSIDPVIIDVSNKRLREEMSEFKFIDFAKGVRLTIDWYKSIL